MKIRVAFVCWGNICRSTLSESVFTYKVKEKGLSDQFVIDSFATSTEEIGNPCLLYTSPSPRDCS